MARLQATVNKGGVVVESPWSTDKLTKLTIHAKIIGGERPLLPEILGQSDRVGAKSQIFYLFSLVAPNKFFSVKATDNVH